MFHTISEKPRILYELKGYYSNEDLRPLESGEFMFETVGFGRPILDSKIGYVSSPGLPDLTSEDPQKARAYLPPITIGKKEYRQRSIVETKVLNFDHGVMSLATLRFRDYYRVTGSLELTAMKLHDSDFNNFFESWRKHLGLKIRIRADGIEFCGLIRAKNLEAIARSWYNIFIDDLLIDSTRLLETYSHVISEGIKRMGFKNTKEQKDATKTTFLYAINDNGNDCEPDWATFPVLVNVKKTVLELRVIFALKSRPGVFNGNQLKYVIKHIKKANALLKNCSFHYEPKKKQTVFKITHYLLYPPSLCIDLPQKLTSEAVHYYTSFGYGFYVLSKSKVTERFNREKGENETLVEQESENAEIKTVTLEKLFKKCVKRNSKPISVFSLVVEGLLHIAWFRHITKPEQILQEIPIIRAMEKSSILKKSFMLTNLRVSRTAISYPVYNREEYKRTFTAQSHSNPEIYEKLIIIIEELASCELGVDLDMFIDSIIEVDSELFYTFKIDLSKQFLRLNYQENPVEEYKGFQTAFYPQEIHQYNTSDEYLYTMHSKLNERILNEINDNPWKIDDLFINFDEEIKPIPNEDIEYFGLKLSKEKVPDENITGQRIPDDRGVEIKTRKEATRRRIDAPFLTIQRYRINQMFQNKYIVRYLGLYDNCTIWAEKVAHNSVYEIIKGNLLWKWNPDQTKKQSIMRNLAECFKEVYTILTSKASLICGLLSFKIFLDIKEPNVGKIAKFHILHLDEIKIYPSDGYLLFIGQDARNGKSNHKSLDYSFEQLVSALMA